MSIAAERLILSRAIRGDHEALRAIEALGAYPWEGESESQAARSILTKLKGGEQVIDGAVSYDCPHSEEQGLTLPGAVESVRQDYERRRRRDALTRLGQMNQAGDRDGYLAGLLKEVDRVSTAGNNPPEEPARGALDWLDAEALDHVQEWHEAKKAGKEFPGLALGLGEIDNALGGLQNKTLTILGGAPGSFKTTLALSGSLAVMKEQRPVFFVSLEVAPERLTLQAIANVTGASYSAMTRGGYDRDKVIDLMAQSAETLAFLKVMDQWTGIAEVERHASEWFKACGSTGLIVVDYLQLAARVSGGCDWESFRLGVSSVAFELRGMAKRLNCPVLAIGSVNRESYKDNGRFKDEDGNPKTYPPHMSDLKESGDIEYDANNIIMLWRTNKPTAGVGCESLGAVVRKNREGVNDVMVDLVVRTDLKRVEVDERPNATVSGGLWAPKARKAG